MTNHLANLEPQRVSARAELSISHLDGRPRLSRLYQEGAAKIRLPRVDDGPLEAVLINTAGGLTGGDRLHWSVDVGTMAAATITTQACEKVYRARDGHAEVSCGLSVGAGGRLAWLPQETIVFERAAFFPAASTPTSETAPRHWSWKPPCSAAGQWARPSVMRCSVTDGGSGTTGG